MKCPNFANIAFILLLILTAQSRSRAQQDLRIHGVVRSDGEKLVGAVVQLPDLKRGVLTDINGSFSISGLSEGEYTVQISMLGFETKTLRAAKAHKDGPPLDVNLQDSPLALDAVEVVSETERRPQDDTRVSVMQLKPREAKFLPGAGEDVMRSLQSLPGVVAPNDFSSQLIIRGSGPDQNLIVMDGIEVFNPYRLYGAISMFNPETVSDISLISGGFPAKYGDRLSAVLDIGNRSGRGDRPLHANVNLSVTNANIVLEGANPANVPGSWLLSTRRTYYDLILGPIARRNGLVDGDAAFPNFRDLQAKIAFGPFSKHRFTFNAVASRDGVDIVSGRERTSPDSVSVFNTLYNTIFGAGWIYAPSDKFFNSLSISWYGNEGETSFDGSILDAILNREDFTGSQNDSLRALARLFGLSFDNTFRFRKLGIKESALLRLDNHALEFGAGWDHITTELFFSLKIDPEFRRVIETNPRASALIDNTTQNLAYNKLHAYVQDRITVGGRWNFHPGVRFDYYDIVDAAVISPRLSISYAWDPITTLRASTGLYYQSPGYEKIFDQNRFFDFKEENLAGLKPERALHAVLGIERWLDEGWLMKTEVYYKSFADLIVQAKSITQRWRSDPVPGGDPRSEGGWSEPYLALSDSLTTTPVNDATGDAYGFEFMLEKRNATGNDRLSGWVGYALSWAQRYRDGVRIPFDFDQRHTANIVATYRFFPWLEAGMFWRLGSNFPYTEPLGVRPRILSEDGNPVFSKDFQGKIVLDLDYGDEARVNQAAKPFYHRLDLRFTATTSFWGASWAFYLDVINVYNHGNVAGYRYYIDSKGALARRTVTMFPILPTLGVNVRL